MRNEILLFPNNEILINALYRTKITHYVTSQQGIRLHISPISSSSHIEDDLDVMFDVFQSRVVSNGPKTRIIKDDGLEARCIELLFLEKIK